MPGEAAKVVISSPADSELKPNKSAVIVYGLPPRSAPRLRIAKHPLRPVCIAVFGYPSEFAFIALVSLGGDE